jgi:ankyrin repeat protein
VKEMKNILLIGVLAIAIVNCVSSPDHELAEEEVLIESEVDIDEREDDNFTALMYAAIDNQLESAGQLIEAGADVNAKGDQDFTALMFAAAYSEPELVTLLLDAGADIYARNNVHSYMLSNHGTPFQIFYYYCHHNWFFITAPGATALMQAAIYSQGESARLLIEAGADVNVTDYCGFASLTYAVSNGETEIIKILLEAGADVNAVAYVTSYDYERYPYTALMHAAKMGHIEIVKLLLEAGADVNGGSPSYNTALSYASKLGEPNIINVLLEAGADVNVSNQLGFTPLMYAAMTGNREAVELLINACADVNAINMCGATASILAAENNHEYIEEMLLEYTDRTYVTRREALSNFYFLLNNSEWDKIESYISGNVVFEKKEIDMYEKLVLNKDQVLAELMSLEGTYYLDTYCIYEDSIILNCIDADYNRFAIYFRWQNGKPYIEMIEIFQAL